MRPSILLFWLGLLSGLLGLAYHLTNACACATLMLRPYLAGFCDSPFVWPSEDPQPPWHIDYYKHQFERAPLVDNFEHQILPEITELMTAPFVWNDWILSVLHIVTHHRHRFETEMQLEVLRNIGQFTHSFGKA